MKLWDILIGALGFVDLHEDKQALYKPHGAMMYSSKQPLPPCMLFLATSPILSTFTQQLFSTRHRYNAKLVYHWNPHYRHLQATRTEALTAAAIC